MVMNIDNPDCAFVAFPLSLNRNPVFFGRRGRGPGELIRVDSKSIKYTGGNSFLVNDSGQFKKITISEKETLIELFGEKMNLQGPFNGMQVFGDGFIDVNMGGESPDCEFVNYNTNGEITGYLSKYPEWSVDPSIKTFSYIKNFVVSDDGLHLASFYGHFPCARFIDAHKMRITTLKLDLPQSEEKVLTRRCYVGRPVAEEEYVLSLYQNQNNSEIHKWTWSGTFIKRTVLSAKVSFFCLSTDRKTMFAWDTSSEQLFVCQESFCL